MKAVRTVFAYLKRSKHYCISAQVYADDVYIVATPDKYSLDSALEPEDWSFMVDSDHSDNAEAQNRPSIPEWACHQAQRSPYDVQVQGIVWHVGLTTQW